MSQGPPTRIAGLTHLPIEISWEWRETTVATRTPVRGEHSEWRVAIRLRADSPFLAALVIEEPGLIRFGRLPASCADPNLELSLSFQVMDWHASSQVGVALSQRARLHGAGIQIGIDSEPVKRAPPDHTVMQVESAGTIESGTQQPLSTVGDLRASCVLVCRHDVVVSHDRWRLPEDTPLSADQMWLTTGRRSGALSPPAS
jgi:hypothetical protein